MQKRIYSVSPAILLPFFLLFQAMTPEITVAPAENTVLMSNSSEPLPDAVNHDVPFVSQAPFGNWNAPYQEACEEAALIMAHYYFTNRTLTPSLMDEEIKKLVAWETTVFTALETNVTEMARIASEYFGHANVAVWGGVTAEDLRRELAAGSLILVPAVGRLLPNPYFTPPGPLYHVLLLKGFTGDSFITNDPGTRRGHNFHYKDEDLMHALNDWNEEDVTTGPNAVLVIRA